MCTQLNTHSDRTYPNASIPPSIAKDSRLCFSYISVAREEGSNPRGVTRRRDGHLQLEGILPSFPGSFSPFVRSSKRSPEASASRERGRSAATFSIVEGHTSSSCSTGEPGASKCLESTFVPRSFYAGFIPGFIVCTRIPPRFILRPVDDLRFLLLLLLLFLRYTCHELQESLRCRIFSFPDFSYPVQRRVHVSSFLDLHTCTLHIYIYRRTHTRVFIRFLPGHMFSLVCLIHLIHLFSRARTRILYRHECNFPIFL